MRLIKNNIEFLFPKSFFIISDANEDDTNIDIRLLG